MLINQQTFCVCRFNGTIVGVRDNKSSGWADSEWRSLKVNQILLSCLICFPLRQEVVFWGYLTCETLVTILAISRFNGMNLH